MTITSYFVRKTPFIRAVCFVMHTQESIFIFFDPYSTQRCPLLRLRMHSLPGTFGEHIYRMRHKQRCPLLRLRMHSLPGTFGEHIYRMRHKDRGNHFPAVSFYPNLPHDGDSSSVCEEGKQSVHKEVDTYVTHTDQSIKFHL